MIDLVVTRHAALVDYLREQGIVGADVEVIPHADAEMVEGKHVAGVMPLHLATLCRSVTEVPMDIPVELRGKELTIEQMRQFARPTVTYTVLAAKTPHDAGVLRDVAYASA